MTPWRLTLSYLLVFIVSSQSLQHATAHRDEHLPLQIPAYVQQHPIAPLLTNLISTHLSKYDSPLDDFKCTMCQSVVNNAKPYIQQNNTIQTISDFAINLCILIRPRDCRTKLHCERICHGVIGEYANELVDVVDDVYVRPEVVCSLLGVCPASPTPSPVPTIDGHIPIKSDLSNTDGEKQWPAWQHDDGSQGYFLHLTDIHLDPLYEVGSATDCGEPLCCRALSSNDTDTFHRGSAGYYGDYNCDLPIQTLQSLMDHLSTLKPPPDFVLYTGDDPAHDIWEQSKQNNTNAIRTINELLLQALPNTPIYGTIGNHEAFPVNQFNEPGSATDNWLYTLIDDVWSPWLAADACKTLSYAGYYQTRIRPGLRVISLNTNYYLDDNYWLWRNNSDYSGQMSWFVDVLEQARARNERAIIIGHSSPDSYRGDFEKLIISVMANYSDVILNHFYGHTHHSNVLVLHDPQTHQPLTPMYIGGAVTTYTDLNPGWRRYYYSRHHDYSNKLKYLAEDYEQFWLDLVAANRGDALTWHVPRTHALYAFGIHDMSAESWIALADRWIAAEDNDEPVGLDYLLYTHAIYAGVVQHDEHLPSRKQAAQSIKFNARRQSEHSLTQQSSTPAHNQLPPASSLVSSSVLAIE